MINKIIVIFIAGIIECFLTHINIKFLQRNNTVLAPITSAGYIIVYFCVLAKVSEFKFGWDLIISNAIGFAIGDYLAIKFDIYLAKLAKMKGLKIPKKLRKFLKRFI